MVLYSVITSYHLLNAMLLAAKSAERSTLVMSQWLVEKFPNADELTAFFDTVKILDANYRFLNSKEDTVQYLRRELGSFDAYSEIYVWGAQFTVGVSLAEQGVPFCYGEEAAGILSTPDVLEAIVVKDTLHAKYYAYIKELGLYDGSAPCIRRRVCSAAAQAPGFACGKDALDLDPVRELKLLPEARRRQITGFFLHGLALHVPEHAAVLLTQHFANLKILSFSQQVLLYQLAVDYFFSREQLVIKPHPDDILYYRRLFPEAQIIRERFPSEFLPFILDHQPDCVATISSTAIFNLRGHYPRVFELDTRYEKQFPMTHRYYAAVTLAQRLGLPLVCEGANEVLAQRLGETLDGQAPAVTVCGADGPDGPCLLLIDDVTGQGEAGRTRVRTLLDDLPAGSCAVLLNTQGDFCWYDYDRRELWAHMAPLTLEKRRLAAEGEDFYASLEEETIYIYSQDKELLDMAKETRIEKDLPHTGLHVSTAVFTPEQERIKMLEGILAATERRLLYYIEKEREAK